MYCENCGNQIKDGALFCNKCGTKVDYSEDESVVQEQHSQQHTLESNSSVYVEVQKKTKSMAHLDWCYNGCCGDSGCYSLLLDLQRTKDC